jgi:hypothetical protein
MLHRLAEITALVAIAAIGCRASSTGVPPSIDRWAREILDKPSDAICSGDVKAGYFCEVKPSLVTDEVRALGAHSITLQNVDGVDRYLDIDWGGGHVDAFGVLIGPKGWAHEPDTERGEKRLRDGVFAYDMRQ